MKKDGCIVDLFGIWPGRLAWMRFMSRVFDLAAHCVLRWLYIVLCGGYTLCFAVAVHCFLRHSKKQCTATAKHNVQPPHNTMHSHRNTQWTAKSSTRLMNLMHASRPGQIPNKSTILHLGWEDGPTSLISTTLPHENT